MSAFDFDVFISYRSSDLALAEDLNTRLLAAGFRVWFDKARLNAGCNWHREIEADCTCARPATSKLRILMFGSARPPLCRRAPASVPDAPRGATGEVGAALSVTH